MCSVLSSLLLFSLYPVLVPPYLTMSLRHSCLLLLFSSLSHSTSFSSLLSCYLCHPCFTFYPRHLCSPSTPSSYLLTIVTSVGIACDRGHRHAAPCHVAQNIQRMWPLTTFLASTDSSIACDCIYLDAAPCHDAQNINRARLLTTLTASTDGSIACDGHIAIYSHTMP